EMREAIRQRVKAHAVEPLYLEPSLLLAETYYRRGLRDDREKAKAEFQKRNLEPKNLSRIIEDSGTLTSPLVPWNTCGAYMAATLGVATLAYLPFAFLNLINPVVSVLYGYTGFTIRKLEPVPDAVAA
ncbi:MAG: Na+/H+ antiporter NhaC family protein, partial [Woeseia sp.]